MISRSTLIWLSRHEGLKDFAAQFPLFKRLTTRFVASETIDEVIPFIRELNAEGSKASFDHLNESVGSEAEATKEVAEYKNILARIDETGINSNVSIKLTQFGLDASYFRSRYSLVGSINYDHIPRFPSSPQRRNCRN